MYMVVSSINSILAVIYLKYMTGPKSSYTTVVVIIIVGDEAD